MADCEVGVANIAMFIMGSLRLPHLENILNITEHIYTPAALGANAKGVGAMFLLIIVLAACRRHN